MQEGLTQKGQEQYRFGFVLTTAAGNMTRYLNLRKYAERDSSVECVWAPISHYLQPDPYEKLPYALRTRLIVRDQARPVTSQLARLDAVMYHAFEPYVAAVLRKSIQRWPLVAWSQDNPPIADLSKYPQYGGNHARSAFRTRLRYRFDLWCTRRTDLFLPFSHWAGEILTQHCGIAQDRVQPINVGLDLELWPYVPKAEMLQTSRPQILFVGGDFVRKGGDLLLDIFRQHFADSADLHLVTKEPPAEVPANVSLHTDLTPNDPRIRALYAQSDIFVLPTRADMSPWVVMEAMATGRPVITTSTGGLPDIVRDGKTGFLIPIDDREALTKQLATLLSDPALRQKMGKESRHVIEQEFSAERNVPRIFALIKAQVDRNRKQA